jgi:hypothetical protein
VSSVERSAERLENDEDKPVYYFPEKSMPTANILLLPQENIISLYPTMVVGSAAFWPRLKAAPGREDEQP